MHQVSKLLDNDQSKPSWLLSKIMIQISNKKASIVNPNGMVLEIKRAKPGTTSEVMNIALSANFGRLENFMTIIVTKNKKNKTGITNQLLVAKKVKNKAKRTTTTKIFFS